MSRITLYLDPETHALVERAARASGLSKSRWVAEAVHKYAADEWPASCLELAGRFGDFPLREGSVPAALDREWDDEIARRVRSIQDGTAVLHSDQPVEQRIRQLLAR